jgi:hypothetical protein
LRNDHKFPEFESGSNDLFAEGREVVLVRVADLFDESVRAESLEQAQYLAAAAFRQVETQCFIVSVWEG